MRGIALAAIILLFFGVPLKARVQKPVAWMCAAKRIGKTEGVVFLQALMDDGWHIYSQHQKPGGPAKASFTFGPSSQYSPIGATSQPKPITRYDESFKTETSFFEHMVIFQQRIRLNSAAPVTVRVKLTYMAGNGQKCMPADELEFTVTIR